MKDCKLCNKKWDDNDEIDIYYCEDGDQKCNFSMCAVCFQKLSHSKLECLYFYIIDFNYTICQCCRNQQLKNHK